MNSFLLITIGSILVILAVFDRVGMFVDALRGVKGSKPGEGEGDLPTPPPGEKLASVNVNQEITQTKRI